MFSFLYELLFSPWIIFLSILVLLLTYDFYRRVGLPPGPYGLPFVGYVFFLDREALPQQCNELCKKYKTDIVSFTAPGPPMVLLNSYDLMKECFQKRSDLADRDEFAIFRAFDDDYTGIITTAGDQWKEVRRFSITMLRDFGMGRVGAEEGIQNESKILCDLIRAYKGKAFDPKDHVNVTVSNIICGMVFGERFEHTNEEFTAALSAMGDLFSKLTSIALFFSFRFDILRGRIFKETYQGCLRDYRKFNGFVRKRIAEHRESYNGEVTDFINGYLKEMEKGREFFDEKMLESLITDFFVAGSDTTSTTLRWAFLAMATNPTVQEKVYQELNDVIGDRAVSMSDKKHTPYTEAVIYEIQRYFTLTPVGATHSNLTEDIQIRGYNIPKKSIVFANFYQILHDPEYWKNADEFDPENFLKDGEVVHSERFIPFSLGRRSCAGEALARMELYIFFTSLMKDFQIKLETDDTVAELKGKVGGAIYQPKPFKIRMIPR